MSLTGCVMGLGGDSADAGRSDSSQARDSGSGRWRPDAGAAESGDAGFSEEVEDSGAIAPARDSGEEEAGADAEAVPEPADAGATDRGESLEPRDAESSADRGGSPEPGDAGSSDDGSYTLAISVKGNGATSPSQGSHTYASGASVQVTAIPESGAAFAGWSGAASGTANPVTVAMEGNKSLTASFESAVGDLPSSCPWSCDGASLAYPTLSSDAGRGNVTMYSASESGSGACNYGATAVMYQAGINVNVQKNDGKGQWQNGMICGQCVEVTVLTSKGPKSVIVRIMDKCADEYCGIGLGGSAPAAVMLDGFGRYDGKWRFVSCDGHPEVSDGSPSLKVIAGSNPDWSRVRVHNPTAAVKSIEWQDASRAASGSFPYAADPENSFEVPVNEVLKSPSASFQINVQFSDGSAGAAQLSPRQLAAPNGSYPLNTTGVR